MDGDSKGSNSVVGFLSQAPGGAPKALADIVPLVTAELRSLARNRLRANAPQSQLHTTDLIHEVYLRLLKHGGVWTSRAHFLALCAKIMRQIVVDAARARGRQRRGNGGIVDTITEGMVVSTEPNLEVLDLDAALIRLTAQDRRKADIIEMVYFGGMSVDEAAEALAVSTATVRRDLRLARSWLKRELAHG